MRDRRDELALELVESALFGDVAKGVDDAVGEPDAGDRKPQLAPVDLQGQRLGLATPRPGLGRDGDECPQGLPAGKRVVSPPAEDPVRGESGDRLRGRVPVLDQAGVVDEEDAVVDVLEDARVPLERQSLLLDLTVEHQ